MYYFGDETDEGLIEYYQFVKENQVEWRDNAEAERAKGNTELFNWYANGCNRRQQELEDMEAEINRRLGG